MKKCDKRNTHTSSKPHMIYKGESNENLKSVTKIRNIARLSRKLAAVILIV